MLLNSNDEGDANAKFIVAAKGLVPLLVDELERQFEMVDANGFATDAVDGDYLMVANYARELADAAGIKIRDQEKKSGKDRGQKRKDDNEKK